jgi:hypothetical protein
MSEYMDRRQTPQDHFMDHESRIIKLENNQDHHYDELHITKKAFDKEIKETKLAYKDLHNIVTELVNQFKQVKWILIGAVGTGVISMLLTGKISLFDIAKLF